MLRLHSIEIDVEGLLIDAEILNVRPDEGFEFQESLKALGNVALSREFCDAPLDVLAISINSSIPRIINIGSTGKPKLVAVPNNITSDALGTPGTRPFACHHHR